MLKLCEITKKYGENTVLDKLSFDMRDSERVAIMGGSGCGKTTLLNIISSLVKADGGSVECDMSIALMFQEHRLIPSLSAIENIRAVLGKNSVQLADKYLELVGLTDAKNKRCDELSGGMAQRASFARMLAFAEATDARLLLLDEPFSALDSELADKMMKLLLDFSDARAVIMVTHDEHHAEMLGGRIIRM